MAWIERMKPRFPGSPWLTTWAEIVSGERPEPVDLVVSKLTRGDAKDWESAALPPRL